MQQLNAIDWVHAVSRALDQIPKIKGVIFVMAEDATSEDVSQINDGLNDGLDPLIINYTSLSVNNERSLPLCSMICDGYNFDFIRGKDLAKTLNAE